MEKITAKDARVFLDEYLRTQLLSEDAIDVEIVTASKKGQQYISVSLLKIDYSLRDKIFSKIKSSYEDRGFKVEREVCHGDFREPGYDLATISW